MNPARIAFRAATLGLALVAVQRAEVEPPAPKVQVRAVVVVEGPRAPIAPETADPAPTQDLDAGAAAPSPARQQAAVAPKTAAPAAPTRPLEPSPQARPSGSADPTDAVADAARVSRAMFIVDGPFGGIDVDCGASHATGSRSVRMVDFPAGSCRVRAHTAESTYETRVNVDRALTVNCTLRDGSDLRCTRPGL